MKIGILVSCIGEFGDTDFYNAQEIGLAKELDKIYSQVIIYKAISEDKPKQVLPLEGCKHTTLIHIPCKKCGNNGRFNPAVMDTSLDALIYFSDIQLAVPKVYAWCGKNNIKMIPYIGVTSSHSKRALTRKIMNVLFLRNIAVYKKCACLAKTPDVKETLEKAGIRHCKIAPIGLDFEKLNQGYKQADTHILKEKWRFQPEDKPILFIGRMTEEKRPVAMLEIFEEVLKKDGSYRLIMVGKGDLLDSVKKIAVDQKISSKILFIDQIPNCDVWELYRISDCFVNLNRQEIFGMALLEAMFYECEVIARYAPGPQNIIENNISGYLVENNEEVRDRILTPLKLERQAIHQRVLQNFTWKSAAIVLSKML